MYVIRWVRDGDTVGDQVGEGGWVIRWVGESVDDEVGEGGCG